jgi:CRP-like cAMP-binding protein
MATENHILAALPLKDYKLLLPYLEYVALPVGQIIYCAGDKQEYLYFLAEGLVSKCYLSEDGASTEFAITGSEGVVGVALILGGITTPGEAVVLSAGHAYRLRAGVLAHEFRKQGSLSRLLLRYVLYQIGQTTQAAACNRHHSVHQRVCRYILSSLDRLDVKELIITQEVIANMLGVRRETVTQIAGELQTAGLIHYRRGHIVVLDPIGLEAGTCECYAADKLECEHLQSAYQQAGIGSPRAAAAALLAH